MLLDFVLELLCSTRHSASLNLRFCRVAPLPCPWAPGGRGGGWQGWRSGESTRLPPMWPGFDSWSRSHMWVEFVVRSRPCSEGFPPSIKTNISKFQFDVDVGP